MTKLRIAVVFAAVAMGAGCYDAPTVNPYPEPWLIDDFEDGDGYPSSPLFENWECRPQDPTHRLLACEITSDPDDQFNNVLHLGSTLWPKEGDTDDFTRSEVTAFARRPLDLRPYSSLTLRAKLSPDVTLAPLLKVQLWCTEAKSRGGGPSKKPNVVVTVIDNRTSPSSYRVWIEPDSRLMQFGIPEGQLSLQEVLVADCLAKVDGIKITVDSDGKVGQGSSATFDLYVDDIKFTRKP